MFKGQSSGETGVMQRAVFRNQPEGKKSAAGSITVDTVAPSCQMSRAVVVVTACDSNHQTRHAIALDRPICTSAVALSCWTRTAMRPPPYWTCAATWTISLAF